MSNPIFVISIHRNEGIPLEPAPFFADGRPSWSAVLPVSELEGLKKTWEKPSKRFQLDVKSVYVDGKRVYPHSGNSE